MINGEKKLSLLDRMNTSMVAIELPPGTLVKYMGRPKANDVFFKIRSAEIAVWPIAVPFKQILMYMGIVVLGPFGHFQFRKRHHFISGKFFAHRFYYLGEMVYLIIDSPDKYYTVFRLNIRRMDSKSNLCR